LIEEEIPQPPIPREQLLQDNVISPQHQSDLHRYSSPTEHTTTDRSIRPISPTSHLLATTKARTIESNIVKNNKNARTVPQTPPKPEHRPAPPTPPNSTLLRSTKSITSALEAIEKEKNDRKNAKDIWWEARKPAQRSRMSPNITSKLKEPTVSFIHSMKNEEEPNTTLPKTPITVAKIDEDNRLLKDTTATRYSYAITPPPPKYSPTLNLIGMSSYQGFVGSKLTKDTVAMRAAKWTPPPDPGLVIHPLNATKQRNMSSPQNNRSPTNSNNHNNNSNNNNQNNNNNNNSHQQSSKSLRDVDDNLSVSSQKIRTPSDRLTSYNTAMKGSVRNKVTPIKKDPREIGWNHFTHKDRFGSESFRLDKTGKYKSSSSAESTKENLEGSTSSLNDKKKTKKKKNHNNSSNTPQSERQQNQSSGELSASQFSLQDIGSLSPSTRSVRTIDAGINTDISGIHEGDLSTSIIHSPGNNNHQQQQQLQQLQQEEANVNSQQEVEHEAS
jgi:hypothetical protein